CCSIRRGVLPDRERCPIPRATLSETLRLSAMVRGLLPRATQPPGARWPAQARRGPQALSRGLTPQTSPLRLSIARSPSAPGPDHHLLDASWSQAPEAICKVQAAASRRHIRRVMARDISFVPVVTPT